MPNLNFFTVDLEYVDFLKKAEEACRGFSRVPNLDYGKKRKEKFLCGVVLQVGTCNYFVPVSSYTRQQADNFLIKVSKGKVVSSLRFNYMFPIPLKLVKEKRILDEPDQLYRVLLFQELQYCIANQETIYSLANRTYRRVLQGRNPGLVFNSCDFKLLEEKCAEYSKRI